jgi:excisionase family DNA binding protein
MTGRDEATTAPLRASEAARRLGVPTRELVQLLYEHKLRYVMVDGIAHVPEDALEEYRARSR